MNTYDPDRLRAELNAAPAPTFDDDLADRAADTAILRRRRRNTGLGVAAVAVIAAAAFGLQPLLDRTPPPVAGTPAPTVSTPSAVQSVAPTPSVTFAPSATPTPSTATTTPSAAPTGSATGTPVGADRLITASGVGDLRVGMTLAEGKAAGLATDQADVCSRFDMTDEGAARYPAIWSNWSESGLGGFAVQLSPDAPDAADAAEYVTEQGIRVGDTLADVDAAYGDASVTIDNSARHWRDGPTEVGLPGLLTDIRMVPFGDRALVFLAEDGAIRYILVTPMGADGKLEHLLGC